MFKGNEEPGGEQGKEENSSSTGGGEKRGVTQGSVGCGGDFGFYSE